MRKPSKELLSEVLYGKTGHNDCWIDTVRVAGNLVMYRHNLMEDEDGINVYELMHLMKVWATKQNFKVEHELSCGIKRGRVRLQQYQEYDMYDVFGYKIGRTSKSDWFDDNSEHEAVTKACEWIKDNK